MIDITTNSLFIFIYEQDHFNINKSFNKKGIRINNSGLKRSKQLLFYLIKIILLIFQISLTNGQSFIEINIINREKLNYLI